MISFCLFRCIFHIRGMQYLAAAVKQQEMTKLRQAWTIKLYVARFLFSFLIFLEFRAFFISVTELTIHNRVTGLRFPEISCMDNHNKQILLWNCPRKSKAVISRCSSSQFVNNDEWILCGRLWKKGKKVCNRIKQNETTNVRQNLTNTSLTFLIIHCTVGSRSDLCHRLLGFSFDSTLKIAQTVT